MGRRRRHRRLLAWALVLAGAWIVARALGRTAPAPASSPEVRETVEPAPPAERVVSRVRRRPAMRPGVRSGAGVRPGVIAAVAVVMLVAGVAAALGVRGEGSGDAGPAPLWSLALGVRADVPSEAQWARVLRATPALTRPGDAGTAVGTVDVRTPEGAPNLVALADPSAARPGRRWVRVRLASDSGTGVAWVRRAALGRITVVRTHLFVDLAARRVTLVRLGRVVLQAPAGIGTPGAPTPTGEFYVRSRLTRYAGAFYGPVAFGLSAGPPALTDWPVAGAIGIHGTNRPQLVPGSVSRGSIRLRNPDVRRLARLLPLGTPVTIR